MTEAAMNQETKSPNKIAMAISFLLALPLAAVLLVHPAAMLDANGAYSHRAMMLIMIGISGGFIHGVGFIPRFSLWKWLFSPLVSWPLMIWGYYTWFLS
ncbi:cytochrome bd biosynthesis protein [Acinetobacter chinensis]|jgi:cyd operon protein YbgE|uniref:Cyd operon YbgE family protein n=1 Tax=Acinetobacter chinensis TaxID=2004650 RepID=A0A3B7LUM6_9GAMM|nr:cyd operon YbgE family protein [Acinetobacter chinensis]AXY56570.1 cytochrome bd biosynthesis protein [Acinetobacter chinensis]MDV2468257.1 cyd operon YbgE family protein [Acinetobacter chinensis]